MVGLEDKPKTFSREFSIKKSEKGKIKKIEEKLLFCLANENDIKDNIILAAIANIGARILEKDQSA